MKLNSWLLAFLGLLILLSFVVFGSAIRYYFSVRELQDLQGRVMEMRRVMANVQSLVDQCLEFRQKNSAIDPILSEFGIPLRKTSEETLEIPNAGTDRDIKVP